MQVELGMRSLQKGFDDILVWLDGLLSTIFDELGHNPTTMSAMACLKHSCSIIEISRVTKGT